MNKSDFFNYTHSEIRTILKEHDLRPFISGILFKWVYEKSIYNTNEMTDIAVKDKETINNIFDFTKPIIAFKEQSKLDKTIKYAFDLNNDLVESVIIFEGKRITQCISTQTGCALGCKFCATGKRTGRDLSAGEIIQQHVSARDDIDKRITNVVYMGMGEPLLNIDNVFRSIEILNDDKGIRIGARKITVSTAGIIPGIQRIIDFPLQITLAISLNSSNQKKREQIMPITKKYGLRELKSVIRKYQRIRNKRITFEYILIPGFNNNDEDILSLLEFLKFIDCKLNIIPYNKVSGFDFNEPTNEEILEFKEKLYVLKDAVIVRKSKGRDISGACGQLKGKIKE